MHDIATNEYRRSALAAALFIPSKDVHPGGAPGTAWRNQFRKENITEEFVSLYSPTKIAVRLPPILQYNAPGRISEDFEVVRIPKELLKRAHSDIQRDKVEGRTKAAVFAKAQPHGEL